MATGLLVTFGWVRNSNARDSEGYPIPAERPALTSQLIPFIDVPQAQKALAQLEEQYRHTEIEVCGTILKDIVI